MQRAVEAKRIALGPSHPAVAESVLGLAAIHRESGSSMDAVDLLQKELKFLTEEGQASSPGISLTPECCIWACIGHYSRTCSQKALQQPSLEHDMSAQA